MSVQRRTALISIVAALVLIALKVAAGIESGSLGLLSEAVHSGTDLVAALLTFFAVGVAGRPADVGHPYGHGKAEHLAALAEASILVLISLGIAAQALLRVVRGSGDVDVGWFPLAVILVVMAIDASRAGVSLRAARQFQSAAFATNALHFGSDLAGSTAVLVGLLFARAGYESADAVAAIFVSLLVLLAASRLMRSNVDVLMDRAPTLAHEAAREAIEDLEPRVQLRRLRMRGSGGRHFADVVIGVPPAAAVGQGHAAANAVEEAVERAVPGADVVVHVEPEESEAVLRERAYAAALRVPQVREIHNMVVLEVGDRTEISLHLKLPGELSLADAHEAATAVEREIRAALPEVDAVQTHLEPLAEPAAGSLVAGEEAAKAADVGRIVREETGADPRELRVLHTEDGLVAFLTLRMEPDRPLAEVHARASEIEARIRREHPEFANVVVHTEP